MKMTHQRRLTTILASWLANLAVIAFVSAISVPSGFRFAGGSIACAGVSPCGSGRRNRCPVRLTRAKKAGQLRADLDTRGTAAAIAATMAGMMVLGKANISRATLQRAIKQIVRLLE